MNIDYQGHNANMDNVRGCNRMLDAANLIIPTTFEEALTYAEQIIYLFMHKQNELLEGEGVTLTENPDGTTTISVSTEASRGIESIEGVVGETGTTVTVTLTDGTTQEFFVEKGEPGEPGTPGAAGVGIASVTYNSQDAQGGNVYDVNLTNGTVAGQITAPKGTAGNPGTPGTPGAAGVGVASVTYNSQDAQGGNVYDVNLTDGTVAGQITAPKGTAGNPGAPGTTGVGVASVTYNSQDAQGGNVYDVNLTNGTVAGQITAPKGDSGSGGSVSVVPATSNGREVGSITADGVTQTLHAGLPYPDNREVINIYTNETALGENMQVTNITCYIPETAYAVPVQLTVWSSNNEVIFTCDMDVNIYYYDNDIAIMPSNAVAEATYPSGEYVIKIPQFTSTSGVWDTTNRLSIKPLSTGGGGGGNSEAVMTLSYLQGAMMYYFTGSYLDGAGLSNFGQEGYYTCMYGVKLVNGVPVSLVPYNEGRFRFTCPSAQSVQRIDFTTNNGGTNIYSDADVSNVNLFRPFRLGSGNGDMIAGGIAEFNIISESSQPGIRLFFTAPVSLTANTDYIISML